LHSPAKNGVNIRKLGMELAQTMVKRVESQVKSCLVAFFVNSFSIKQLYAMLFLLGYISHIITPCTGFHFFEFF
jgi:hypothetical protein